MVHAAEAKAQAEAGRSEPVTRPAGLAGSIPVAKEQSEIVTCLRASGLPPEKQAAGHTMLLGAWGL